MSRAGEKIIAGLTDALEHTRLREGISGLIAEACNGRPLEEFMIRSRRLKLADAILAYVAKEGTRD